MGIVAKLILQGRNPVGCIVTMLLGVVSAFVGGSTYKLATGTDVLYFRIDIGRLAIAILVGVVIPDVYRIGART